MLRGVVCAKGVGGALRAALVQTVVCYDSHRVHTVHRLACVWWWIVPLCVCVGVCDGGGVSKCPKQLGHSHHTRSAV